MIYVATCFAALGCVTLAAAENAYYKASLSDSKVMRREASSRAKLNHQDYTFRDHADELVQAGHKPKAAKAAKAAAGNDTKTEVAAAAGNHTTHQHTKTEVAAAAGNHTTHQQEEENKEETKKEENVTEHANATKSEETVDDTPEPPTPAPTPAPTPTPHSGPHSHLERKDVEYSYIETSASAACDDHYEFLGMLRNEECAKKCFETYGCSRFSAGGCSLGCRISVPGKNNGHGTPVPPDGQCPTSDKGVASDCIVYELSFFHASATPARCDNEYEMFEFADTKAQCAHACKNTPGCKRFTTEPNCIYGCRISKGGSGKCGMKTHDEYGAGCTGYELFR
jgi:hypothetical protein